MIVLPSLALCTVANVERGVRTLVEQLRLLGPSGLGLATDPARAVRALFSGEAVSNDAPHRGP